MSNYEHIWNTYKVTTDLRAKRSKSSLSDYVETEEYIPRRNSTWIAPKLRDAIDEVKSPKLTETRSAEQPRSLFSPITVENKSPDEVISSEESDWNYDDLSVISSSEDEKDDVTDEIRPTATAENLHQLDQKHDSAVQVDSSVQMVDAAVQMNSVVKTDSSVQVDFTELKQVHAAIMGSGDVRNRKPKRSSGGKASKCKISQSFNDTKQMGVKKYISEVALKSPRKTAKQIINVYMNDRYNVSTKPAPSSSSFYNVRAEWNDDVIIPKPKRIPKMFDGTNMKMDPRQHRNIPDVEIVSSRRKEKQILDVYMNDAYKVSKKPSPLIGGSSSYINRQVKQRETDWNNYRMAGKLIKVKSAISTFR